jgi:hypothetical protein
MSKTTILDTNNTLAAIYDFIEMIKSEGKSTFSPKKIEGMVKAIQKVPGIINKPTAEGEYPIIVATKYSNAFMLEYMMKKFGAKLEGIVDQEGHSPLFHALHRDSPYLLQFMKGANLNTIDKEAIKAGSAEILEHAKSLGLMDAETPQIISDNNLSQTTTQVNDLSNFYNELDKLGSYVEEAIQTNGAIRVPTLGINLFFKPSSESIYYQVIDKAVFNVEVPSRIKYHS